MAPTPNRYHQDISRNLVILLGTLVDQNALGKLYGAPFDVYLSPHDVFQPDIVYIANDRLSILKDDGAHGAPTLLVEILSPRTANLDREAKKAIYVSTGVEELWLISPHTQTVEIFRLQVNPDTAARTYGISDTFTSPYFPDLQIEGQKIFKP